MFGPWLEVFIWLRGLWPGLSGFKPSSLNFITLHYIYIIGITLLGSVIIYPAKNIAYIDALFFAAGSSTQSGLNTVNVNDLLLYQQITIMLLACITNPIFINTFVVFVRLYWFEKRFQSIVLEARNHRRTRERSRSKSEAKEDPDFSLEEKGVGGRDIVVIHPGKDTINNAKEMVPDSTDRRSTSSSGDNHSQRSLKDENGAGLVEEQALRREITFADEINKPTRRMTTASDRFPMQQSAERHIAFLQRQRDETDDDTLYIPGPRDFDRGVVPQKKHDGGPSRVNNTNQKSELPPHRRSSGGELGEEAPKERLEAEDDMIDGGPITERAKTTWSATAKRFIRRSETYKSEDDGSMALRRLPRSWTLAKLLNRRTSEEADPMPYLSYQPTIGRNSMFVNLSEEQREELGGIEYRSLKTLAVILCCYFFGFHLFGMVCFVPWILHTSPYGSIVESDGITRTWWGIFTPPTMFNDLGFTLTPDSMLSFQNAIFPLLVGSFLIIIGNTGFPCMLRLIIWIVSLFTPRGSALWEELRFLLDHPRRCFTLLFPSKATWWLFWVLFLLNATDLVFYIILDLNDPVVTVVSAGLRVVNGWFQAASTRTAGLAVVNIAELHPGIQVSYLVMMYISVFPIAISVRRTNVYEEKSLGIWSGQDEDDEGNETSFVGAHLRRQLSFDLWYVFLGLFLIAIIEGVQIQDTNNPAFTLFNCLFEIVSAYGTVGLSLGYPNIDESFSAVFHTLSKLIIVAMMIRGRHRGLPYALDRAILLPSEELHQKEDEDEAKRAAWLERRNSAVSARKASGKDAQTPGLPRTQTGRSSSSGKQGGGGLRRLLLQALSAGPAHKLRGE